MASALPRKTDWVSGVRRQLAATAVRGRRRLQRESGLVDVVDMKPMVRPDGEVVQVPLIKNDYCRWVIGSVGALSTRHIVALAFRAGLVVPDEEKPRLRVSRG